MLSHVRVRSQHAYESEFALEISAAAHELGDLLARACLHCVLRGHQCRELRVEAARMQLLHQRQRPAREHSADGYSSS